MNLDRTENQPSIGKAECSFKLFCYDAMPSKVAKSRYIFATRKRSLSV